MKLRPSPMAEAYPASKRSKASFHIRVANDLARAGGSAAGDDPDVVEDEERVDDRQQHDEYEGGPDPRQRNVQELLPAASAVYLRRFVEFLVHGLQGGQEQKQDEAPPGPVVDEGDGWQSEARVPEEGDPVEKRDSYRRKRRADAPFGVEDVLPDRAVNDAGNDVGNEVGDPEEQLEAFYLREQERPEQPHRYRVR